MQIYSGKDATFTLVEDDGETTAYESGNTKRTTLSWNEASRTLSWSASEMATVMATGGNYFTEIFATLFIADMKTGATTSEVKALSASGSIAF